MIRFLLEAALQLFDLQQLGTLVEAACVPLEGLERGGRLLPPVRERLALMEQAGSRQGAGQRPRQLSGPS